MAMSDWQIWQVDSSDDFSRPAPMPIDWLKICTNFIRLVFQTVLVQGAFINHQFFKKIQNTAYLLVNYPLVLFIDYLIASILEKNFISKETIKIF